VSYSYSYSYAIPFPPASGLWCTRPAARHSRRPKANLSSYPTFDSPLVVARRVSCSHPSCTSGGTAGWVLSHLFLAVPFTLRARGASDTWSTIYQSETLQVVVSLVECDNDGNNTEQERIGRVGSHVHHGQGMGWDGGVHDRPLPQPQHTTL
jgi:hypothetical protein